MTNPINPMLDPSSNIVVSSLLNGKNYHLCSRAMTMALQTKNKRKIIKGWLTWGVKNWEILKHSRLSEIWLAWARERGVETGGSSLKRERQI
ncbi:hypothetical protein Lal_00031493 [Lupinus albus]|nr:hypothetical protein Lal_00031493 [Lupinus albus]